MGGKGIEKLNKNSKTRTPQHACTTPIQYPSWVPDTVPPQKFRLNDYDDKFKAPGAAIFFVIFPSNQSWQEGREGKEKFYQNIQEKPK